jgi:hypothetical protein
MYLEFARGRHGAEEQASGRSLRLGGSTNSLRSECGRRSWMVSRIRFSVGQRAFAHWLDVVRLSGGRQAGKLSRLTAALCTRVPHRTTDWSAVQLAVNF